MLPYATPPRTVAGLFCNSQVFLVKVDCFLELAQPLVGIAKLFIRRAFSNAVPRLFAPE